MVFSQVDFVSFDSSLKICALIGITQIVLISRFETLLPPSLAYLAKYLSASRDLFDIRQPAPDYWLSSILLEKVFERSQ